MSVFQHTLVGWYLYLGVPRVMFGVRYAVSVLVNSPVYRQVINTYSLLHNLWKLQTASQTLKKVQLLMPFFAKITLTWLPIPVTNTTSVSSS